MPSVDRQIVGPTFYVCMEYSTDLGFVKDNILGGRCRWYSNGGPLGGGSWRDVKAVL